MNIRKNIHQILLLLIMASFAAMADQDAGDTIIKRGAIPDDYYVAGGTIDVDATVAGDVLACGGDVTIAGAIEGDLMVCGGTINIKSQIADDLRTAGGDINIDTNIGDDLIAAGGSVNVSSASSINGGAWLAGGDVSMAGTINQGLFVGAGMVRITGTVNGDVEIEAGEVQIGDGAVINGSLKYTSPNEATIHSNATITGEVSYTKSEWEGDYQGYGIFFIVTMIVAASALFLLFPGFTLASTKRMSSDPWRCIGIGIVFLIITPITAVVLMAIVLGVWIGLTVLALYLVSILIGYLIAIFFVGDWAAKLIKMDVSGKGKRILSALIAIIILALLQFIPVIGGLVAFILLLLGIGAGLSQVHYLYRQGETPASE